MAPANWRLTTRCSGRVTIKCTRPTVVLALGSAAMRRRCGAPPLNGDVSRHDLLFALQVIQSQCLAPLLAPVAITFVAHSPRRGGGLWLRHFSLRTFDL